MGWDGKQRGLPLVGVALPAALVGCGDDDGAAMAAAPTGDAPRVVAMLPAPGPARPAAA